MDIKGTVFSRNSTRAIYSSTSHLSIDQHTSSHQTSIKMRYSIVLALATAASAVNIEFFGESHCRNGAGVTCTNANPNFCCNGQRAEGWAAVQFSGIPGGWDLVTDAYAGDNCVALVNEFRSEGREFVCHGDNRNYKSGGYHFFSKKRGTYVNNRNASDEECVRPDQLFLADRTTYDISGLTDNQVEELVC
jgi:hypothetical protein